MKNFLPFAPLSRCRQLVLQFAAAESGATAIEYGLIAALGALAAIPALGGLGGKLSSTFGAVASALDDNGNPAPMPAPAPPSMAPMLAR